jgi:cytochrome b
MRNVFCGCHAPVWNGDRGCAVYLGIAIGAGIATGTVAKASEEDRCATMEGQAAMHRIPVWDIFVRVSHWSVAFLVLAEFTIFDEDWAVHRWAGYAVLALVALRLIWGLMGPRYARFSSFPPSLQAARTHLAGLLRGMREQHLSHNPLGALMAYNLWSSLVAACLTGILMTTGGFRGADWLEELHEAIANWVLISVGLHVAGVAFETWHSKVNLVQAMINGQKEIPGPGE